MKNILKSIGITFLLSVILSLSAIFIASADVTNSFWIKGSNGELYTNSGNGQGNAIINVAGCNGCGGGGGVTSLNSLTGALNVLGGTGISVNSSGSDITVSWTGAAVPTSSDLAVRMATTAALAGAPVYNNGSSGVGATLTRGTNGALASQDGIAPQVGDYLLVKNQSAQLQNGVYVVTTLGSASVKYVLTRVTEADTTAELDDLVVTAALGTTNKGVPYGQQTNNPTIGTSNIVFTATGIYMRQQTSGTQAVNQIPVYTGTALTLTKGTANFKYNPINDLFTIRGIDYLFPANNGDASQVLTTDGSGNLSWETAGGGSPAGSDTQIQYNNAGSFGASSDFIFDQATSTFTATNNWEVFRTKITFASGGGTNDLTASDATAFTGTPPTTFAVLAFGNIQVVNYINLVGGNFNQGDTITGSVSGAEGYVAYDDGVGQFYVSITNSIQFAATDVIDNANGVTADYDTSTTSDDIFFWFSTNGGSGGPIVITGTAQTLNDGIDITFGSVTGHGAGDSWEWSYKTLKNTLLTNRIFGAGILDGAINGQYFKSGSGSSIIQSMSGFFQNGNDDRIFPLSAYEDLTSGNNADKERAYYGFNPFKNQPTDPLEYIVHMRKGVGIGPFTTDITEFKVNTVEGFRLETNKSILMSSPLFNVSNQTFSWNGDTNSTGITIDDNAQTIRFNNNYTFPFSDGTANQYLKTDGSGNLSWGTISTSIADGDYGDITVSGSGTAWSIDTNVVTFSKLQQLTTKTVFGNSTGSTANATAVAFSTISPVQIGTATSTLYSQGLSGTGQGDTSTGQNIILGVSAGASASNAYNVNFLGQNAGNAATNAYESNFFGLDAGRNASNANDSNFLGYRAGYNATSASRSNFFGYNAGQGATSAYQSNFFGYEAGLTASSAGTSNFIGYLAGRLATNAANSNFMGNNAGSGATNAANSIFIGKFAGNADTVNISGASTDSAILIGSSTKTGGFKNSVAIGNGATNTAANQFLVSAPVQPFTSMAFITSSAGFFRRDAGIVDSRVTAVAYGSTTNLTAGHYDIEVTTGTGATTVNLPTGTTSPIGTTYIIKDLDAIALTSNITIDAGSGNTINDATIGQTYVMAVSGLSVTLKKVTSTAWAVE